jgi:hypothetical protein
MFLNLYFMRKLSFNNPYIYVCVCVLYEIRAVAKETVEIRAYDTTQHSQMEALGLNLRLV